MVSDRSFYRTIFTIALPSAFQAFVSFLVVLADNMMVASLGDTVFAGVVQSNGATALFIAVISGLVGGSSVLISQYWGKKDTERIKKIFAIVGCVCLLAAVIFVALIQIMPTGVLSILTSDESVIAAAVPYLTVVCWSYIPYAMSAAFAGMLRSVEVVKVTLYTTIMALFSNIGFNALLIPSMGAKGAALATVIARVIEFSLVWYYLFHVQKKLSIKPKDLLKGERVLFFDYLRYGIPVAVVDTQWAIVGLLKTSIIGRLGKEMISANSIGMSLMELGTLFTFSLAGGACVVIGKTVGEGDYDRVREYSGTIQIMFLAIGVVMSALVFLLRVPFASLYGVSPEARKLASEMIAIAAVSLIGTTYHASCFVGINRGAGDSRFVMVVDMICGWLIVLPVAYIAAFVLKLPLPWMFLMLRIDQLFKWIIAFFRLRGNAWIRNVTRDGELRVES